MQLNISQDIKKNNGSLDKEVEDLTSMLSRELENQTIEESNFINELKREFNIPAEELNGLKDKIDEYMKRYSARICTEALYVEYNSNDKKYYQNIFYDGTKTTLELSKKEAKDFDLSTFYSVGFKERLPNVPICSEIRGLKDYMKLSIKQQLAEGRDIKDVDLFEIDADFRGREYDRAPMYKNAQTWDKKNFINEIGKEFDFSKTELKSLNTKINNLLKSLSNTIGKIIYVGYDKDKNSFYRKEYNNGKTEKYDFYDAGAISDGIGTIHIPYHNEKLEKRSTYNYYTKADFLKDDIKAHIQKSVDKGVNPKDIDFSKLERQYKNSKYVNSKLQKARVSIEEYKMERINNLK